MYLNFSDLRPPKLTVNPQMITETDSVTVNCQTPSSVSVSQCYFIIAGNEIARTAPCLQTLTGSEFLSWTRQSSPVTVEMTCYYIFIYKSPVSNMSPITIQTPRPELTVNPQKITETDSVTVNCQTPSSVSVSQCFLYFMRGRKSTSISCLQTLTATELLSLAQQSSPAEVDVTCFYSSEHKGGQYQSPHSNRYSISIQNPRPELTVNPQMITETDSVTVNCQTPSSVPVSQCYFIISGHKPDKAAPCLQTLTGSEFLSWTRQSSPLTAEVTCYYFYIQKSPESNMSPINIQPPRPELTVNPTMITETDSVTVKCQTPSSVSVTQCFLYFTEGRKSTSISCQQTLTATELLSMAEQSLPVDVEVTCFYTLAHKGGPHKSLHSNTSSISIQTPRPELTMNLMMITETDSVTVKCQTPSSVSVTQCFLYFMRGRKSTSISCQQTLTGTELLSLAQQSSPAEVEVTCFYMSQHKGGQYQSPHSNISFINIQMGTTSSVTTPRTSSDISVDPISTKLSTTGTTSSVTTPRTSSVPSAHKLLPVVASGFGVIVGIISLGMALFCVKRRNDNFSSTKKTGRGGWMSPNDTEAFNMTSLVPGDDPPKGSNQLKRQESQTENSSLYYFYSSIPEEPDETPTMKTDLAYSTLQAR
ncbi:signaling mucin MSB2-like [Simochromis diagramma]|uniref:signaling mucin MSB2-like n=1 Tax=Simochromis diagramma TaxID=43689 RepID=UPI001A7E2F01|nr:signaling mucin MSB2-like [Simochromis diagramma]